MLARTINTKHLRSKNKNEFFWGMTHTKKIILSKNNCIWVVFVGTKLHLYMQSCKIIFLRYNRFYLVLDWFYLMVSWCAVFLSLMNNQYFYLHTNVLFDITFDVQPTGLWILICRASSKQPFSIFSMIFRCLDLNF